MRQATLCAAALAALSCVKHEAKPGGDVEARSDEANSRRPTPPPRADARPTSQPVTRAVDCPMMNALISAVRDTRVAMDPRAAFKLAVADWEDVPDDCRDGRWYMLAAHLLRTGYTESLSAGDQTFDSPAAALTEGLSRDPSNAELLELVAYLSALAPGRFPALPAGACDSLPAGTDEASRDRRHYICGQAALAANDPRAAATELGAITNRRRFPDLELRYGVALLRSDDRAGARAAAEKMKAVTVPGALAFGATEGELDALKTAATQLLASL